MESSTSGITGLEFAPLPSEIEDKDWRYSMRREMQLIIPGLYLGPYAAACKSNIEVLLSVGISHIVCIRQSSEVNFIRPNFPSQFTYLVLEISDIPMENIIQHFQKGNEFIRDCLCKGGKVLVHGNNGISRSAALVLAYIMETFGVCYKEAFTYVQQKRFCIQPNDGFVHQLVEYESIYRARLETEQMSNLIENRVLKRELESDFNENSACKRKWPFDNN